MRLILPFKDLALDPRLLRSVQHLGFARPTEIQQEAIPAVMVGRDLIVSSQTGSGKTLAYLLPMMQRLLKSRALSKQDARALILAPTRELAKQVYAQLRLLVANTPVTAALIVGGENFNDQEKILKRQPAVVVATPGRFVDHLEHKTLFLQGLEMLILDEADRMLDLGFLPQLTVINKAASHRLRQTLLFSATLDHAEVDNLALALLKNPYRIAVGAGYQQHQDIEQQFFLADNLSHKEALLQHFLQQQDIKQLIMFTATRADAERLTGVCEAAGFTAIALSGKLAQQQRNSVMQQFATGKFQVLVTTDLASRGLDLLQVSHVINFDLPKHPEEYVHRIGRTGRAGAKGQALSLVGPKDWPSLQNIEKFLRHAVEFSVVEDLPARFSGIKTLTGKTKTERKSASPDKARRPRPAKAVNAKVKSAPFFEGGDDGSGPVRRKK
ncbi:DEAD/DEAH box helicase [Arsukibacterium indicum]|uniref:DEAD/DEAH box helicase n=1 Tax=Arsukibacterium indicum TaxID=2848612 RepID=A0ABS6MGX1_9GAMM|nr:DEAD/DEAH box helicase [Arsukibacterium indicum]MBV2128047.1 DEAD/DEAH box helicase [Arsukibacterium indicum]